MKRILHAGRNCWRVERASRAAALVDAADYFSAFRQAVLSARRRILILGWDMDSNLRLVRNGGDDGGPLGDFLNGVVSRHPRLEAHVLIWDFAMIYAAEREWLPVYRLGWKTHRRLRFRLDGNHPVGGSHHQKVVVIDDAIAFVGGMDLGKWRWDTPAHAPDDPRRTDAAGNRYHPYHDLQMVVDGAAARALGELVRERWWRATGEAIPPPDPVGDPWPASVPVQFREVDVAIARTEPRYAGHPEIREVERLYLDAIDAAQRYLYIENQYLTGKVIRDALAASLQREAGPEIVIVVPERTGGWLEHNTMDVRRRQLVRHLLDADRYGRLRIVYPHIPGLAPQCVSVHSKLMIADDRFLRIGSSNLNNRSMGLDTECDLAIDTALSPDADGAIVDLRNRLLGEHTGLDAEEVARRLRNGSLRDLVDGEGAGGRGFRPLDVDAIHIDPDIEALVNSSFLVDPEQPVDPEKLAERVLPEEQRRPAHRGVVFLVVTLTLLLGLAAAWRWTPMKEWLDVGTVVTAARGLTGEPWAPAAVVGGYVVGGLVMVPVTFLVVITVLAFGPVLGFAYSLAGSLISAAVAFGIGNALGRNTVRKVAGSRLNRLSRRLAKRGLLAIVTVRIVPVAPFTVVNLVAGVSHIRFGRFMLGTLIGMLPGLLGLSAFMDRLIAAIRHPDWGNFAVVGAVIGVLAAAAYALRRWLARRRREEEAMREVPGS